MLKKYIISFLFVFLQYLVASQNAAAIDYKAYGFIQPEITTFFNGDGRHDQSNSNQSIFVKGTFITYLNNGDQKITINTTGRIDEKDSERSYIDFQKFKYEQYFDDITLKIGNELIFWGVNESFNIVDIINQSNLAEDISGTKKFGQPMISLNYYHSYGNFDLLIMPFFKERIFPGRNGRPRLALEVDESTVAYESSSKKNKIDAAVRYSTVYDDYDIGIAHFYGNNRSPELNVNPLSQKLDAYYPILSQTSLDIQSTKGAWLYKLETLTAKNGEERHFGIAGGTEYTIYGLRETTSDLGIIVEYTFDDRNDFAFNNEGVLALRWTKNDIKSTSLLAGLVADMSGSSNRFFAEFEQRIRDDLKVFIDMSINGEIDADDFTYAFEEDSQLTLKIAKYF